MQQGACWAALLALALLFALGAVTGCDDEADQSSTAPESPTTSAEQEEPEADVSTPTGLLEWIAANPDNAGLVVLSGRGKAIVSLNGDERFPLASTRKVLIAAVLTGSGTDLETPIPRAAVERFYAPGTDGGAHERARLNASQLTLAQVAAAAIQVSDNAAADALLEVVGTEAVDAYAEEQGMASQDPIYPLLGEFAAWSRVPGWAELSPAQRAREAIALAKRLDGEDVGTALPPDLRELVASSVAGIPAEWAALMRTIGTGDNEELIEILDWPRRQNPDVRAAFTRYLTKGGSLPGVVTEASFVQPRGEPGSAVALFLRDLPPDVEGTLAETFSQQELIVGLASDDEGLLERAAELLDE